MKKIITIKIKHPDEFPQEWIYNGMKGKLIKDGRNACTIKLLDAYHKEIVEYNENTYSHWCDDFITIHKCNIVTTTKQLKIE